MEESVVKHFLEYKPLQSLEETEHTRTPSFFAGQQSSISQHYLYQHHHATQNNNNTTTTPSTSTPTPSPPKFPSAPATWHTSPRPPLALCAVTHQAAPPNPQPTTISTNPTNPPTNHSSPHPHPTRARIQIPKPSSHSTTTRCYRS